MSDSKRNIADKEILVVGGSSGMGLAIARQAAAAGARVTILGRDAEKLQSAKRLVANARTQVMDLRKPDSISAALADVVDIDHLVITAGTSRMMPLPATGPDDWRELLEERIIGPLFVVKLLAPRVRQSITLFSGTGALRPVCGKAPMAAAVAGVINMAKALALELSPLRVNCVVPGLTDTPLVEGLFGADKDQSVAEMIGKMPARRMGTPDDIAHAALMLMENPYMTGSALVIDGGGILV